MAWPPQPFACPTSTSTCAAATTATTAWATTMAAAAPAAGTASLSTGRCCTAAGNVGLGLAGAQPSLRLDVAGGLALRPNATIPVTADDQTVPVGNSSYLRLSSNSSTASSRTIVLGNGLQAGQLLMLENAGSSGSFELPDSANVDVSGTLTLTTADVVQLVWNGGKWVALSYSNN